MKIAMKNEIRKRKYRKQALERVELFEKLPRPTLYIITSGTVDAIEKKKGEVNFIREMKSGEWFGEKALFNETGTRTISIKCTTVVTCLTIDKDTFKKYIGSLPKRKKENSRFRPS